MHILKCCRNQPKKFCYSNKGFYLYFLIYSIFYVSNNHSGITPYFLGVCQVSQSSAVQSDRKNSCFQHLRFRSGQVLGSQHSAPCLPHVEGI